MRAHASAALAAKTSVLRHTLTRSAGAALPRTNSLLSGIRALLRRSHPQRIVQEADHASNNGGVGKVKDVPVEAAAAGFDVKEHKIHDSGPMQAVDGVADRPANDEAKRHSGEA